MTTDRRSGWMVAAIVLAVLGVLSVVGNLWSVFVDGAWLRLFLIPVALAFYYWVVAGALRRARADTCP